MKKVLLSMLAIVFLATSALAYVAPTKPALTALSKAGNEKIIAFLDATLWGVNQLNNDAYVQAYNTATGQTYYMTIPYKNSTSITLPPGNYNISVSLGSSFANIYVGGAAAYNKNYWTFYGITLTSSPSTVVSVGT